MKYRSSSQKTARTAGHTASSDSATGRNGMAIAPPAYGIDVVDNQPGEATPEDGNLSQPLASLAPPDGTIQRVAAPPGAGNDSSGVRQKNGTGLPDNLKAGIENLSGMAMDDVNVHYNSTKPAQLRAHAYAQGSDIHLGPGHERHLPHEAWHVVQQKQGRVKPSLQMKGVAINADLSLENEADVMGSKALRQTTPNSTKKKQSRPTSDTVQPWWPLGHRTVTTKAFEYYDDQKSYDADVQAYLIDRSPDMDFAQDVVNSMEAGIAVGKANIEKMKDLLAKDPDDKEALRMWNENELHFRPDWYATLHGEGGRYKNDEKTGASINEAITKKLVNVAVTKYNGGAKEAGLSLLSDALHQAEDRGAHMEGEEFKGHDSRLTIEKNLRPQKGKGPKGEGDAANVWYSGDNTTYTDDAAHNVEGAKKAIKLAIDEVFTKFLAGIEDETVVMGDEKEKPSERRSKFAGKAGTTSTSRTLKSKYPGKTSAGTIRALTKKDIEEYTLPETRALTKEEETYVGVGVERYQDVWIISELTERIRANLHHKWKTDTFESRKEVGQTELNKLLKAKGWFEDPESIGNEKKQLWVEQAVHQYQYQRSKAGGEMGKILSDPRIAPLKAELAKLTKLLDETEPDDYNVEYLQGAEQKRRELEEELAPLLKADVQRRLEALN